MHFICCVSFHLHVSQWVTLVKLILQTNGVVSINRLSSGPYFSHCSYFFLIFGPKLLIFPYFWSKLLLHRNFINVCIRKYIYRLISVHFTPLIPFFKWYICEMKSCVNRTRKRPRHFLGCGFQWKPFFAILMPENSMSELLILG